MRLPAINYQQPRNLQEALDLLNSHGTDCAILAGGTDLLVRMKQRLTTPGHLISLKRLNELSDIQESNGQLRIGAAVRLADILAFDPVKTRWPGLFEAVRSVGAPSIQHSTGTIGGNLCQESRCIFYNQSDFFRGARQTCRKAGGETCFAKEGGSDRCHSAYQSDIAPMLMAMDTTVAIKSKEGERTLPISELFSSVGEHPFTFEDNEILVEIRIADSGPKSGTAYEKLAYRSAIDYPIVSAGVFLQTDGERINKARLIIGAVASAPLRISAAEKILEGSAINDKKALEDSAKSAMKDAEAFIVNNMTQPAEYRAKMVAVVAKRALESALSRAERNDR